MSVRTRYGLAAAVVWGTATLLSSPAAAETPGKDGDLTVSGAQTLNEYSALVGGASAGATSINAASINGDLPSLEAGDLVMLYQANGASISTVDSAAYGAVTSYNNAGRYEFQTVASVSGNTITLAGYNGSCPGLTYSYDSTGGQIIRVPQFNDLTVPGGTRIRAPAWNGSTGGVVALHVDGSFDLSGRIDVTGIGFRGGVRDNETRPSGETPPTEGYRYNTADRGGRKGESIAGPADTLPAGGFGRGAPANGGGGGNAHNAGGGGGANGGLVSAWNGQGNPDRSNPSWDQAWNLDPTLSATTTSSGGGRGGYSFAREGDPLTLPPGQWTRDRRREVGGLGGRPLDFDAAGRIFFGGGGGAGDANNDASEDGAPGGGIALVIANAITGSGRIDANGRNARPTLPTRHNDAPGGGGGGGTVLISADSISSSLSFRAFGGAGGDQLIMNTVENEGPGGGGGGGIVALSNSGAQVIIRGGANGTSTSQALVAFPPNGATRGGAGTPNAVAPPVSGLPFCVKPDTSLDASKAVEPFQTGGLMTPSSDVAYTFTLTSTGADPLAADSIELTDSLPSQITFFSGEYDPGSAPVSGPVEFSGAGTGLSCCTGTGEVEYSDTTSGPPVFGYTPNGGYDDNVRHIRISPSGAMNAGTTATLRFRARVK